jgi:hypothetical protein
MLEELAARLRSSDTDLRLLVPLLISTMLVQRVSAMVRVTTSYRAHRDRGDHAADRFPIARPPSGLRIYVIQPAPRNPPTS